MCNIVEDSTHRAHKAVASLCGTKTALVTTNGRLERGLQTHKIHPKASKAEGAF